LIQSTTKFFIEFFKRNKYKIIVIQCVDNYVSDILTRIATYLGIPVIGIVNFFYSGYIRITTYGEHNTVREVSSDEIDLVYKRLVSRESSSFNLSKGSIYKELLRQYIVYKFKYLAHYLFLHKVLNRWEYEYAGTPAFGYPSKLKNFFPKKYFEKNLSAINGFEKDKLVYIPLHFFPEATTEYWVESPELSPYYPSLFETVQELSNLGYKVIIKEHPALYLKRDISVYLKLKSIKNVFLIEPFLSTYELLDRVDYVVVWTGTTGIEAAMQDKKVLIVSENYYSSPLMPRIEDMLKARAFSELEKKELVKRILENCLEL